MIRSFRTIAAAAASLAIMGSAPAPHVAPMPQTADERGVDPEQLALARRLMALLASQMNLTAAMQGMNAGMLQAMRKENPNIDRVDMDRITAATDKAEADVLPDLLDDLAHIYARHLTRKEMEDSISFYESTSGQSMMHKLPEMTGDVGPLMAKYIPRMRASMIAALCAEDACTEAQRQALLHPSASH